MLNKPVAAETITEEAASSSPQEKDRQDETNDVRIESGKGKEEKKKDTIAVAKTSDSW